MRIRRRCRRSLLICSTGAPPLAESFLGIPLQIHYHWRCKWFSTLLEQKYTETIAECASGGQKYAIVRGENLGFSLIAEGVGITHLRQQRRNDLLAIGLFDGSALIADVETMRVVRRVPCLNYGQLTDLQFDTRCIV